MRKKEAKDKKYLVSVLLVMIIIIVLAWLAILIKHNQLQREAAQKKPSTLDALKKAADSFSKGNYVEAIRLYKNAMESEPENYGAHIGLGQSYIQLGIYDEAIKTFGKSKQLDYHDFRTYYGLGLAYYRMEEYNKAYENFRIAYNLNPNDKAVVSYLINTQNSAGLYDDAIKLSSEKLKKDANNSHYYRKIAIAYFLKNNLGEAMKNAQMAVEIYDDYAGNDLALGVVQLSLGQKENALSSFKAALIQPQHTAYEGLSISYRLLGQIENAEKNEKLASFYPPHSNSLGLLGFALLKMKSYDLAIKEFNSAIKAKPDYYLPYKGLGMLYLELGQKENAVKNFERALALNRLDKEVEEMLEKAGK